MKVTYWSDYACPFCYIGETVLKQAFRNLNTGGKLELVMKSFELDTAASREVVSATPERFAEKYGLTHEAALQRINAISEMGKSAGIDFRYASTRYTSTFDAHRLTKLAQDKYTSDIAEDLSTRLYAAYFTANLELSSPDVLMKAGIDSGMSREDINAVLSSDIYGAEVRQDEQEAYSRGIHAVPFFMVEGKYYISGAQSLEAMTETLRRGLGVQAMTCGADGCRI